MTFLGEIKLFAGTFAPIDWAFCNGQILPIAQNQALFSLLSTQFGGDGTTSFGLPDLRGRTPVGSGTGFGLTTREQGNTGGLEDVALLNSQMPAHQHQIVSTPTVENTLSVTASGTLKCASTSGTTDDPSNAFPAKTKALNGDDIYTDDATLATTTMNSTVLDIDADLDGNIGVTVQSQCLTAGESFPHENMQPWLCLNYIICVNGNYPERS